MKILLGMSGGVDSTYAALKLRREGHAVEGAVLVMHDYSPVDEATESAAALGMPLHVLDCRADFERAVVSDFIAEYRQGRTPNPCVICNRAVKFAALLAFADENGFDAIATGHYASVVRMPNGRYTLRRPKDAKKDQTYMLWSLSQSVLSRLLFPLSEDTKDEVRSASAEAELAAASRSDSQEICFLPDGDYSSFIESRAGECPRGNFVDENGNRIGEHRGIIHYTIGQRKGLGVALGSRVFVTAIDPVRNTVTLSEKSRFSTAVAVRDLNFLAIPAPSAPIALRAEVKLRYAAPPVSASVEILSEREAILRTETPVRAVTAGQSAVFYDAQGHLLLGGFIERALS